MIKYFTCIVVFLALASSALAQPVFTVSDAQGNTGDVVSVDVTVKDFKAIIGFQFLVKFDPAKLGVKDVKNLTTIPDEFDQQNVDFSTYADKGLIRVAYANAAADDGFTIPDDGLFFTIEFEIVATGNTTATVDIPQEVDFGEFVQKVEMIDNTANEIGMTTNAGTVTIGEGGSGPGRVSLSLGSASGSSGETVCIPLKVTSFTELNGMQYSIKFDTEFLEFVEGRNFNLTNFSGSSISTENIASDMALIISWSSPDTEPLSIADGTTIAELCFKIKKSDGSSDVSFSGTPQEIEFSTLENGGTVSVESNLSNGKISAGDGGSSGGTECDKPGFSVAASATTAPKGSNTCVDIVGKGIDGMAVLQTIINWDPAVLSNPSLESANLEITSFDYSLEKGAEGKAILSWTYKDLDGPGITLEDNSLLFKLCFDVIGDDGESSSITFTGDDRTTQLAGDVEGEFYTFQQCDGSVTVGQPEDISVKKVDPTCNGNNDGSISLTVNTGQSPYTFAWTKDGEAIGAKATVNALTAGTYSYVVTDNTGAEIGKADVMLEEPDAIQVDSEITPIDQGDDGAIDITVSGGTGAYMYNWSTGDDTEDLSGLGAGTYTLTVTDANGCSVSEDITIGSGEFNVMIEVTTDYNGSAISCNGESDASLRAKANFGVAPYTYQWNTGDETETLQNVGAGDYKVTVTDKDGQKTEATFTLTEPESLIVRVSTTPSNGGSAGTAKAEVRGGTQPYAYEWNDKSPGSTTVFIGSLTEGSYRVVVEDANGCMTQGVGRVPIDDRDCFTAAKVMTPNADGLNDELRIACVEGTVNTLMVFDRYGAAVYQEDNYNNLWTGTDGDGNALGDGVYYYVLEVKEIDGSTTHYKGHVTLLRRLN